MTPHPVVIPRRIGQQQLAFVRCWAEGLDITIAWHRFMPARGAVDARRARGELQRLLDELRGLARAHGRPDIAALLCRDPEAIRDIDPKEPSLETFRDQQPPDFYSEDELLALYQAAHGRVDARSSARRRQRLRERLLLAIQWLERQVVRAPVPADTVSGWLDERVALRLSSVGIRTLGELMFWIRVKGFNWHRAIPKLGAVGAGRIAWWLQQHEASLGPFPSSALVPVNRLDKPALTPRPRTGMVPLERFVPPSALDGTQGSNRAPAARCKIAARTDQEAVQAWLGLRTAGSHTWRAYRKEVERFLLWAMLERRRALSSLDGGDCLAYRDFLAAPGPGWCGPRNAQRWSEAWRPFEGGLSLRSAAAAITIVRGLCAWLVRQRYLDSNPWDELPSRADVPSTPALRALSVGQWVQVRDWVCAQPASPAQRRLAFILHLAYTTGMRLSELCAARLDGLRHQPLEDGQWVWCLRVQGRRQQWREVPLLEAMVQRLRACLADRGLHGDLLALDPQTPLIGRLAQEVPLSPARLHDLVKSAFEGCARDLLATDRRAAELIRGASTHWLRHTHGVHAIAQGMPPDMLQAHLGHERPGTTALYVQAERARRHRAVQAAFLSTGPAGPDR